MGSRLANCRSLAALLACGLLAVAAKTAAQAPVALSLSAALERVERRAPELVLADSAVREVEARREGAGIILPSNPRLSVEARPLFDGSGVEDLGYSATLDLLFDLGGAPGARIEEVRRDVELARAQRSIDALYARLRVLSSYVDAQLAELRISEARSGIELAQRVLDAARRRIEAGAASDFEAVSAQLELSKIQAAEQAALRERDEARMRLRDGLDLPADQPLELTTPIEAPVPLAPLANYLRAAEKSHPELIASQARLRALRATRDRLEREVFPKFGLYGGIDSAPKSPTFAVVGISGELPVAQRNQGPRAVVARATETELVRADLQRRRIARDIDAAWRAYEHRRAELEVLSRSALPAAQRSFELAEAGWKAGRFDWFRVALAARDLVQVRAQRLEALSALWAQRIVLARARGVDEP